MRILRLDEQLAAISAPELQAATLVPAWGADDTLIMCAGFEDRAIEVLRRGVTAGGRGFRVICIDYLPANEENRTSAVNALCSEAGATCVHVTYDREKPAGAAESILRQVSSGGALHIDVSGMSRLLIVQLVAHLTRARRLASSNLFYAEAHEYSPTHAEVETRLSDEADPLGVTMFLSTGVFGLTVVPELSSVAMQGQPIRVISFPSWNATQMAALCSEIQSSYFTIINGTPPSDEHSWRPDAIRKLNRMDSLTSRTEFYTSTLDYRETLRLLLEIYRDHAQQVRIPRAPDRRFQTDSITRSSAT